MSILVLNWVRAILFSASFALAALIRVLLCRVCGRCSQTLHNNTEMGWQSQSLCRSQGEWERPVNWVSLFGDHNSRNSRWDNPYRMASASAIPHMGKKMAGPVCTTIIPVMSTDSGYDPNEASIKMLIIRPSR